MGQDALTSFPAMANSSAMHAPLPRRAVLLPLLLAGCGRWQRADRPAIAIEPLTYDHLTKLRLNVALVDVEERLPPPPPGDVSAKAPTSPVNALRRMAQDRLLALGGSGRAAFIVKRAALLESRGGYDGIIDVELAIFDQEGTRVAFAEARVARRHASDGPPRETLYDMTRQMMDAMNVELEFQARRNLRAWLLAEDAQSAPRDVIPAPVEQQDLAPLRR